MRYLFELSGEHPDLPIWEAESLLRCNDNAELIERDYLAAIFNADTLPEHFQSRIALSHYLSEHIATVNYRDISSVLEQIDLTEMESIAINIKIAKEKRKALNIATLTKEFGKLLAKKTKIDLERPSARLRIYLGERAHIGRLISEIDRSQYERRKNRYLPFVSPISIHPRLARALINLTAKSEKDKILDPFCGTGAFLIESSLMGMETYGSDISEKMISGSRANLEHLKLSAQLKQLDVGEIDYFKKRFDCIVTDPPYGRSASTRKEPLEKLYARALDSFVNNLDDKGRVGIIVPDINTLSYESNFNLIRRTSIRVHKSLTRNFEVLELK